MGKLLKYLFVFYVICLAGYVSYTRLMKKQFGQFKVEYTRPAQSCDQGGEGWNYCVYTGERSHKKVILYVLHGKGQSERFWFKDSGYAALLQQYWETYDKKYPTVVTVSFGDAWLLTPENRGPNGGLMNRFFSEVIPSVEEKLGMPRQRFIMGNSMGGLNALSASLEQPKMFRRVAALCPPMYRMSPHAGWKEIIQFIYRSGAEPHSVLTSLAMGRYAFSNTEEWLEYSPLERIKAVRFQPRQHFYVSAGLRDEFGLFEGVQDFVYRLQNSGAIVHWQPYSGRHCSVDIESLGRFLSL